MFLLYFDFEMFNSLLNEKLIIISLLMAWAEKWNIIKWLPLAR